MGRANNEISWLEILQIRWVNYCDVVLLQDCVCRAMMYRLVVGKNPSGWVLFSKFLKSVERIGNSRTYPGWLRYNDV